MINSMIALCFRISALMYMCRLLANNFEVVDKEICRKFASINCTLGFVTGLVNQYSGCSGFILEKPGGFT